MTEDWKKEAFEAYLAKRAEEETVWRRNNPGKLKIYLVNASDDPQTFSVEGQVGLRNVIVSLEENKIKADATFMTMDSVDAVSGYTGEIALLATAFGPALTGILVAWLQSKAGRKVRIKDGDIEIEARTLEEIKKGFDIVAEQRAKREQREDK